LRPGWEALSAKPNTTLASAILLGVLIPPVTAPHLKAVGKFPIAIRARVYSLPVYASVFESGVDDHNAQRRSQFLSSLNAYGAHDFRLRHQESEIPPEQSTERLSVQHLEYRIHVRRRESLEVH
jgi:hypothetical protein